MKLFLYIQKSHDCTSRYSTILILLGEKQSCGKHAGMFLEHVNINFLTQVIMDLPREGCLLDLILTSKSLMQR